MNLNKSSEPDRQNASQKIRVDCFSYERNQPALEVGINCKQLKRSLVQMPRKKKFLPQSLKRSNRHPIP